MLTIPGAVPANHNKQRAIFASARQHLGLSYQSSEPGASRIATEQVFVRLECLWPDFGNAERKVKAAGIKPTEDFVERVLALPRMFVLVHEPCLLAGLVIVRVAHVRVDEAKSVAESVEERSSQVCR